MSIPTKLQQTERLAQQLSLLSQKLLEGNIGLKGASAALAILQEQNKVVLREEKLRKLIPNTSKA